MLLNEDARQACEDAAHVADDLKIKLSQVGEANVLDFGVEVSGGLGAGIVLAEICMGTQSSIHLAPMPGENLPRVIVETDRPLEACMASQYAGWPVQTDDFFAMGSGPIRSRRGKEELLTALKITDESDCAVAVLETGTLPNESVVRMMAKEANVMEEDLILACAPTSSIAGTIQVVARSIETAMHKLFELGFDLTLIQSAYGHAPMPPIGADDLLSIGLTNDSILYGGEVTLWVECGDEEIAEFGPKVPSSASKDYGRPFREIFEAYDHDFYKIDPMLFSPAKVTFVNMSSGKTFVFGKAAPDLLAKSFNMQ